MKERPEVEDQEAEMRQKVAVVMEMVSSEVSTMTRSTEGVNIHFFFVHFRNIWALLFSAD